MAGKGDYWYPVRHPKSGAALSPRLLGGAVCPDEADRDPRVPLARWLTAADNPYFARSLVNRVWAHHLGRGLVEPTDAHSAANPPSHPDLLDALAADFATNRFDLRRLHRTILSSRTYQLDWKSGQGGGDRSFSHYLVKRLPAEVLVDAIDRVTGAPPDGKDILVPPATPAIAYPLSRAYGRVRYAFGQSLLLARRLVEAGVRFVTVQFPTSWDTHERNFDRLKAQHLPWLDCGVSALLGDLEQRGLLEGTVVFMTGEFGRTPRVNKDAGRDHWPHVFTMFFAGGGVKAGQVVGASDAEGAQPAERPVTPEDVAATFYHLLGIDHTREYQTPSGRPIAIVRDGRVIPELVARSSG